MLYKHDPANEISKAQNIYLARGAAIMADPALLSLLDLYRGEIDKTWSLLEGYGVIASCHRCATEDDACCCFSGVEKWYDSMLYLLNLLMGVKLPTHGPETPGQCYFNSSHGCLLLARYSICVGFFCPELQQELGAVHLAGLRKQVGAELGSGLAIEQAITRWLQP